MARKPEYREHKASGQARCQFNGKRHYLGPYGSPESKQRYAEILAQWAGQSGEDARPTRPVKSVATVYDLLGAFVRWAQGYHDVKEMNHYKIVMRILKDVHADTIAADFGPRALKEVRGHMAAKGWSYTHINAQVARVIRIFKFGVSEEMVPELVPYALKSVRALREGERVGAIEPPISEEVQPVPWRCVEAVLPHMSVTLATMVCVHFLAGMRSSEVCRLSSAEIDFTTYAPEWLYAPKEHKTRRRGKVKLVFFGPAARALLEPYVEQYTEGPWFRPIDSYVDLTSRKLKNKSVVSTDGKRFAECFRRDTYNQAVSKSIKRARKAFVAAGWPAEEAEAAFPAWHPHQLRHARATLTRERYDVEGAAAQTGNTVAAAQIYAKANSDLARRIARETG